jgi:hypothetical protein
MPADHSSVLVLGTVPSLMWQVTRCLRSAGHSCWARNAAALDASQLQQFCRNKSIEKILAVDACTVLRLEHLPLPTCATPSPSLIRALQDKWNLTRCAAALGLPVSDTIRANDAAELLANSLVYPIVTKPLAWDGRHGRRFCRSLRVLARQLRAMPFPLLAQSFVPGWDVGATFLAKDGRLAACSVFRHTRRGARTFYPSIRVRDYLESFVTACRYNGIGHLRLRYDPMRDSYAILAMDAGFPASLLYAQRAGLNYPDLLLRLESSMPAQPAVPRMGRVGLSLYERGMLSFLRDSPSS